MVSNITLTSSMRSNLSSLKSLASQMSTTQTRLSTGKKVNNAIDNANSYYQSRALTNRSSDLDMLLDAMGQSIQTITAAVEGLEATGEILEKAAVIAQNAYEKNIEIPSIDWFRNEFGDDNTVFVSSVQELYDAIDSNKSTICIYGNIDIDHRISLNNQKLVGINYFGDFTENSQDYASTLTYRATNCEDMIIARGQNEISSLNINFDARQVSGSGSWTKDAIYINNGTSQVKDVNINMRVSTSFVRSGGGGATIKTYNSGTTLQTSGNIKIDSNTWGIFAEVQSKAYINGNLDIISYGYGIGAHNYSSITIQEGSNIAMKVSGNERSLIGSNSNITIENNVNISTNISPLIYSGKTTSENRTLKVGEGVNILYSPTGQAWKVNEEYYDYSANTISIRNTNIESLLNVATADYDAIKAQMDAAFAPVKQTNYFLGEDLAQYSEMMTAFDELVSDAGYQGVNLLADGHIDVMFNETRTHSYNVQGKDMSSAGIGITTREWVTKDDVAQSIKEIKNAMNSVRDMVENLGNHLSIIQTRMDFTDAMTDILQTGADDLVLADMNEESANYLALQTRNSLAVNALALAAQSNNSVLKLF